jgi:hypothetical protein
MQAFVNKVGSDTPEAVDLNKMVKQAINGDLLVQLSTLLCDSVEPGGSLS